MKFFARSLDASVWFLAVFGVPRNSGFFFYTLSWTISVSRPGLLALLSSQFHRYYSLYFTPLDSACI